MKIEDRLKGYRILEEPTAREEKIMETVRASQNAFFEREQEQQLSRWEFLWIQMKFIRKKWWALQALLLAGFWCVLQFNAGAEDSEVQRQILGIAATLFTILIIPEFWKNRSSRSMEIEEASFFSLRQVLRGADGALRHGGCPVYQLISGGGLHVGGNFLSGRAGSVPASGQHYRLHLFSDFMQ